MNVARHEQNLYDFLLKPENPTKMHFKAFYFTQQVLVQNASKSRINSKYNIDAQVNGGQENVEQTH